MKVTVDNFIKGNDRKILIIDGRILWHVKQFCKIKGSVNFDTHTYTLIQGHAHTNKWPCFKDFTY